MWFSAIKLAVNAGSHIYKKKQETKGKNNLCTYLNILN